LGVFPSADGSSVAQPVSLVEWFLDYYQPTKRAKGSLLVECVAEVSTGDIVI
jgi:hypothetical protein